MDYNLLQKTNKKTTALEAFRSLWPLMREERWNLFRALLTILVTSTLNLLAPVLIAHAIDAYISTDNYHGVLVYAGILFGMYLLALVTSYYQTRWMGGVGQRVLYNLRNALFTKLQSLPVAFFNQNKAGDLISRINNDTDKLNQFFSQSLVQFAGNIFVMIGAGIFLISINFKIGLASLVPALVILIITRILSGWVKRKNAENLRSTGGMSAEISESLDNFKVIVAFNRRDYFRRRFEEVNTDNYKTSVAAGIANNSFTPIYGLGSQTAQLVVLLFGIDLILRGQFTIGLLISFIAYVNNFYNPLRQLAALWANFQIAMAGWDRISAILSLDTNLLQIPAEKEITESEKVPVLQFNHVYFKYPDGKEVLHDINFTLERGKTYALVGPTGGGKTTTASLMARLYDPTEGEVLFLGRDIRSVDPKMRTGGIGFILQEPFLFTGTLKENIIYGNDEYSDFSTEQVLQIIKENNLDNLLSRFDEGLDTIVSSSGESLSLGQRQLVAFIRAVLRKPKLLILDEATANIDTVTEELLEDILKKLPQETTRVIIAHRLNTIENADEIFFVNGGEVTLAGSMEHAVEMLLHGKRKS